MAPVMTPAANPTPLSESLYGIRTPQPEDRLTLFVSLEQALCQRLALAKTAVEAAAYTGSGKLLLSLYRRHVLVGRSLPSARPVPQKPLHSGCAGSQPRAPSDRMV